MTLFLIGPDYGKAYSSFYNNHYLFDSQIGKCHFFNFFIVKCLNNLKLILRNKFKINLISAYARFNFIL